MRVLIVGGGAAGLCCAIRLRQLDPALQVTGRTVEDSSPSRALIEAGREASMLVMGTNSRNALGRTLFGSVTHSVLLNLKVPTIIVPQA